MRPFHVGLGTAALIALALGPIRAHAPDGPAISSVGLPTDRSPVVPSPAVPVPERSAPATTTLDPSLEPARGRIAPASRFEAARASFDVRVDGEPVHFAIRSVLLLPTYTLTIEAPAGATLTHAAGIARVRGDGRWVWEAPREPGVHALRVESSGGDVVDLVAFVLHGRSRTRSGALGAYRIGTYRETPLGGRAQYLPPVGFVEVAAVDEDIRVSPHITLGEILCKQPGDPRFATFTPALLDKLETVLEAVNREGIEVGALTIMSGFRTPWYNRSIGNTTDYSRHLWGDAADIYIDVDGDGDMDDLNGDGRHDVADARVLGDVVERVRALSPEPFVPGGMSLYRRNAAHGPFVHVDARGQVARW